MTSGPLSRQLARLAAALWVPIAALYTFFIVAYVYGLATRLFSPPMAEVIAQLLSYLSIAVPAWFLVWALWSRSSWRVATIAAIVGGLLFVLLAGTLFGILALSAGLLPLVSMAIRPER